MRWSVEIWMVDQHARSSDEGWWALCCWVFSAEMLGVVERAFRATGQRIRVTKHE